jgi:peptidoglycan hydrolase CwlO-like protein
MNENLILIISNALTGIATFFVSRKQQKTILENTILDNLAKSIGVYQTIIQDLKEEIAELNLKVNKLEERITDLMEENKKLRSKKPLEK